MEEKRNRNRGKRGRWETESRRYNVWEDSSILMHTWVAGDPVPYSCPTMSRYGGEIPSKRRERMHEWQEKVMRAEWSIRRPSQMPLDGPLAARLVFLMLRPKSKKKSEVWADTAADVDNLTKAVLDALQRKGLIKNDARIVELHAAKIWTPHGGPNAFVPGVRIELRRMSDELPKALSKTRARNHRLEVAA